MLSLSAVGLGKWYKRKNYIKIKYLQTINCDEKGFRNVTYLITPA